MAFSDPGAPPEPQRTTPTVGVAREELASLLRAAIAHGLLGQEALEPRLRQIAPHEAVPGLVTGSLDVALVDLATLLGERALGWDGVAIAAFGPASDRSVGVAVVERSTWANRRDLCERLVRACERAREQGAGTVVDGAWGTCRPDAAAVDEAARWAETGTTAGLAEALAWSGEDA
jgi:hypothetical protein